MMIQVKLKFWLIAFLFDKIFLNIYWRFLHWIGSVRTSLTITYWWFVIACKIVLIFISSFGEFDSLLIHTIFQR